METANDRMDKIEVKLQDVKPNLDVKATEIQIEKIEKEIEKLSKEKKTAEERAFEMLTEKGDEMTNNLIQNLKPLENKMEEISKFTKELDKKWSDDNKFMEGTYLEIKSHIEETDAKFRENSKEIARLDKKIESEGRIISSFKNFIKAVME
jgi:predicted  nucleic acid-binding Zn-ribbon protein